MTVIVELRPARAVTETELREFSRSRIAGFKCPKQFLFLPALPRTASGKVKRAELRLSLRQDA